jgi:hypothetical protein
MTHFAAATLHSLLSHLFRKEPTVMGEKRALLRPEPLDALVRINGPAP